MRSTVWFLTAFLLLAAHAGASSTTTVILVRHAEKASSDEDPPLSSAGTARAEELARVLSGMSIDAIYTTQFRRTIDTAAPVAAAAGVEPHVLATGKTYAADLAARIVRDHAGETVLVVGHSNSTRDVLRHLGVSDPPAIAEAQYDDLFICTIGGGTARLLALRYGATAR